MAYELDGVNIYRITNECLDVNIDAKNQYGEVFTPPELINKLLDLFPKKVWSNPDLKWLDPSCGIGNFFMYVYLRLMHGLRGWNSNKSVRHTHIIENMLYMVEINSTNYKLARRIFGSSANILCMNFLEMDVTNWPNKFDCVVTNPPFNDDRKLGKRTRNRLYERMFMRSFELLVPNGKLGFITPDNIFSGGSANVPYHTMLNEGRVKFISFNCEMYFPAIQQPVCYFFVEKNGQRHEQSRQRHEQSQYSRTLIENHKGERFYVILRDRPLNPVRNWTLQLERLVDKYLCDVPVEESYYNRGVPVSKYKGDKYDIIYNVNSVLRTDSKELAVGLGVKKVVIFLISPNLDFYMDFKGDCGVGPNTVYIPFDTVSDGKKLRAYFDSDEYKMLALATKTTRQFLRPSFLTHLDIDTILSNKETNSNNKTQTRSSKRTKSPRKMSKNKTQKNKKTKE